MMMNIKEQLAVLGISGQVYKAGREIKIPCPFHPDDEPSCSVNLETGIWMCYARCGGGNWMQFIERIRHDVNYAPITAQPQPVQDEQPVLRSWLQRGFTRDILRKWSITWDASMGAMQMPFFGDSGEQFSSIWRFPEGITPKYRYPAGFERNKNLYGIWRLRPEINALVLVEGPLDAIWVQEAGLGACAIMGSSLSQEQAELVSRLKPRKVLLCFDNDVAGLEATTKAASVMRSFGCWVYRVLLPQRWKDIQEVPREKVNAVLANTEICVNGSGMVHPRYRRWSDARPAVKNSIWR